MRTKLFFLLAALTLTSEARSDYNVGAWMKLPDNERTSYVMGVFDGVFTTLAAYDKPAFDHYENCINTRGLHSGNVTARNFFEYVRVKPELHDKLPSFVFVTYLANVCGKAPSRK